jgi:Rrf2 family iron-sulfur cluster assembly transcriptional regulator
MRPPSRVAYALRALVDLALHQGAGPVTLSAVAKRQSLPVRYLEQLFNRLRREGIVEAERGPRGGYRLKLPADQLSVSAVFKCLQPKGLAYAASAVSTKDPTASVWKQVERAVDSTLKATTLGALVSQVKENAASPNHRFTFHI